jgi:5-bromo-4-chloroindolyl phosphate hydrolysis protein
VVKLNNQRFVLLERSLFMININFEEARTLIDELHRENRITNNEYNILRDCIDEAENKIETLLSLVQYHIDELEDVAKNAIRALRGMF